MPGVYTVTSVPHQKLASGGATNCIFRDLYQRSENVGFVAKMHIRRIPRITGDLRHFLGGCCQSATSNRPVLHSAVSRSRRQSSDGYERIPGRPESTEEISAGCDCRTYCCMGTCGPLTCSRFTESRLGLWTIGFLNPQCLHHDLHGKQNWASNGCVPGKTADSESRPATPWI